MTKKPKLPVDDLLLHRARQTVPDLVGPIGAFSSNVAPGAATLSTSCRSSAMN